MLGRFFVTLLSVVLLSSGCTRKTTIIAEPNAENLALYELKGNVKEVTEERYEAIKIDNRLVKGQLCMKTVRHFTPNGYLIDELIFDADGHVEECIRTRWDDADSIMEAFFLVRFLFSVRLLNSYTSFQTHSAESSSHSGRMDRNTCGCFQI